MKKLFTATITLALLIGASSVFLPADFATAQQTPVDIFKLGYNISKVTPPAGSDGPSGRKISLLAPILGTYNPADCKIDANKKNTCTTNFGTYLKGLFKFIIALSGVLAVVMITVGGFEYMLSATELGKSDGMDRVKNAFLGLALVLFSYLILYTINPQLLEVKDLNISGGPLPAATGGSGLPLGANTNTQTGQNGQQGTQTPARPQPNIDEINREYAGLLDLATRNNQTLQDSLGITTGYNPELSEENNDRLNVAKATVAGYIANTADRLTPYISENASDEDLAIAKSILNQTLQGIDEQIQEVKGIDAEKDANGEVIDDEEMLEAAKLDAIDEIEGAASKMIEELYNKVKYREQCAQNTLTNADGTTRPCITTQ